MTAERRESVAHVPSSYLCRGGCGQMSFVGPGFCEPCRLRLEERAKDATVWCIEVERTTVHEVLVRAETEQEARDYAQDDVDEGRFVDEITNVSKPRKAHQSDIRGSASIYCGVLDRWVSEDELEQAS